MNPNWREREKERQEQWKKILKKHERAKWDLLYLFFGLFVFIWVIIITST